MEGQSGAARGAARRLRREQTPSERAIWVVVRARRFHGLKFRRQHLIGRFVVDFYCNDLYLAVEVDGDVHESDHQRVQDGLRTASIERAGINVVRVPATDALADPRRALERYLVDFLRNPPPGLAAKRWHTAPAFESRSVRRKRQGFA